MSDLQSVTVEQYNYASFVPEKFEPFMRFDESPALGQKTSDYTLWTLEREETSLHDVLNQHLYTIVEFGSFT